MNLAGQTGVGVASTGEPSDIVTTAITAESLQEGLRRMEVCELFDALVYLCI